MVCGGVRIPHTSACANIPWRLLVLLCAVPWVEAATSSKKGAKSVARRAAGTLAPPLASVLPPDRSFAANFSFWSYCENGWSCLQNPDGSVTLNTDASRRSAGLSSNKFYYYGIFSVEMKLPPGNSRGIWDTFYLMQYPSDIPNNNSSHAEIDIEFYGRTSSKNFVIATNIIVGGWSMLEQHRLPFDPSEAFHRYTIMWSPFFLAWFVDGTAIRVTQRKKGMPWPTKPLQIMASIWDTSGGQAAYPSPVVAVQYRRFYINACELLSPNPPYPVCVRLVKSPRLPWNAKLSPQGRQDYINYQKYIINKWNWGKYDGKARLLTFGPIPPE